MAGDEDRAKAEKIAAAKKRVEQLKKKKASQSSKTETTAVADNTTITRDRASEEHQPEKSSIDADLPPQSSEKVTPTDEGESSVEDAAAQTPSAQAEMPASRQAEAEDGADELAARFSALQLELSARVKEVESLQAKVISLEEEVTRLTADSTLSTGVSASEVFLLRSDHIECDARLTLPQDQSEMNRNLESRVKELEAELYEIKSGHWRQGRTELQHLHARDEMPGEDGHFDEIDLSSSRGVNDSGSKSQGIGGFLADGLSALTGANPRRQGVQHQRFDTQLDDDLEDDLLESEMMRAREEEARKRVERIRQIKKELVQWKGWRLDLVNDWTVGRGTGEVFEI